MTPRVIIAIQPVEIDGRHWVSMRINGCKMKRHGPFLSADVAEAMADQLVKCWRAREGTPPAWAQAGPDVWDADTLVTFE